MFGIHVPVAQCSEEYIDWLEDLNYCSPGSHGTVYMQLWLARIFKIQLVTMVTGKQLYYVHVSMVYNDEANCVRLFIVLLLSIISIQVKGYNFHPKTFTRGIKNLVLFFHRSVLSWMRWQISLIPDPWHITNISYNITDFNKLERREISPYVKTTNDRQSVYFANCSNVILLLSSGSVL